MLLKAKGSITVHGATVH